MAFCIWKPQVWYGSTPAYSWAHMLVPKIGGPNWIPCSILPSVAEPVFHSSVVKHVCYTSPPGSAASFPSSCGDGVSGSTRAGCGSTRAGCGSRYSRVHGLHHGAFLTPFKADGIGHILRWRPPSFVPAEFNWTKSKNLGSTSSSMASGGTTLRLTLPIMSCYIIKYEAESWKRTSCCFTERAYDYFAFFGQHLLKLICL